MKLSKSIWYLMVLLTSSAAYSLPPPNLENDNQIIRMLDTDTWIDANHLLMFVTNKGSFAFDQGGLLGNYAGLYYPYLGIENIQNGTASKSVVFAAGIWIGGVDSVIGDTLVTVAEYSDDYFPGPIVGGTFVPNADILAQFRVYKIYMDSAGMNPNQDYLEWPIFQGAPSDNLGNPRHFGNQTLWSVFNDANSSVHNNDAGSKIGLGFEIQHSVWANLDSGGTDILPQPTTLAVEHLGNSSIKVVVDIVDPSTFTGDYYMVVTGNDQTLGPVWHLLDLTMGDTVLANQTGFSSEYTVTDGFAVRVSNGGGRFESFEVVANANGPLDPPSGAAFEFQGFPSTNPDQNQQVGNGYWAIHTGDNGGTSGGGTRGSYAAFLERVVRNDDVLRIGLNDFEMRFTGSYASPGVNGGYAIRAFQDDQVFWVPFELWRIGSDSPDDPTDDVRLTPWVLDWGEDLTYNLESWGTSLNGSGLLEHSASGGDNDPYTDLVYWYLPNDTTAGQSGYLEDEAAMLSGSYLFDGAEIFARTVFINWNGGEQPPFSQDLPEQGTILRIRTIKTVEIDSFTFTGVLPPVVTTGSESLSIYSKYKIINKSPRSYFNCFISLWFDHDIGNAGDDLAGCDTLNDIFFGYNDGKDNVYGDAPPAFGGKLLEGPIVASIGDTAYVDGRPIPNYKNLGMYSFSIYGNGTDPVSPRWTYQYMNGLNAASGGIPWPNGSRYAVPGDPVIGTGDLDFNSTDRRMMPTFGPIDFRPNDTQQLLLKLAVGQGTDHLSSITELRRVLFHNPMLADSCCLGIRGDINADGWDAQLLDMIYLVNYIFRNGRSSPCLLESDVNSDGKTANILDLNFLINYLFRNGHHPGICYP